MTLISGPVALATPAGVQRVDVRSAQQMFNAVKAAVDGSDVFVSVAAVADWKVKNSSKQKIKKVNGSTPVLELEENPDILAWVAALKNAPFCVGFAAESEKVCGARQGEAGEEGRAADRRQPRAGGAGRRRQRDHAVRRARRAIRSAAAPRSSWRASWSRTSPA